MISKEKSLFWSKTKIRILLSAGLIIFLVEGLTAFLDGSDRIVLRNIGLSLMIFASIVNPPNFYEKISLSALGFDSFIFKDNPLFLIYLTAMLAGLALFIASFVIN